MRKAQKEKETKQMSKIRTLLSSKRLQILVVALLFGAVGAYLVFRANALPNEPSAPNPPLTANCHDGLDVALLYDPSGSMDGPEFAIAKNAMRSFVNALHGKPMSYAINKMDRTYDRDGGAPFSQNTSQALSRINAAELDGGSEIGDLRWIANTDPRPNRQNLIIVLSDFKLATISTTVNTLKRQGSRFLALEINDGSTGGKGSETIRPSSTYTAGPNVDTGSIFTSDVITVNFNSIGSQFASFAQQLCNPPGGGGPGPGHGHGSGGSGTGTDGQGSGTGPGPGAAGGGGGSSATHQGSADNTTPSSSSQGDNKQQPDLNPSPFFDGKLFAIGSDTDSEDIQGVTVAGKKFGFGWIYLLVGLTIVGVGGFFGWKWWMKQKSSR